jgi:hypothetical protein
VCGAVGGISAYLHPLKPMAKVANPPPVSEQIVAMFVPLAIFGLIASVVALLGVGIVRRVRER